MENSKLLLVEDEPIVQKVHSYFLKKLEYSYQLASNGKEAMQYSLDKQYDLIFMDIGLPDYSGIHVTNVIRDKSINALTPIIVLTGYQDKEIKEQCFRAGATEVYTKPINLSLMNTVIQRYLKK